MDNSKKKSKELNAYLSQKAHLPRVFSFETKKNWTPEWLRKRVVHTGKHQKGAS